MPTPPHRTNGEQLRKESSPGVVAHGRQSSFAPRVPGLDAGCDSGLAQRRTTNATLFPAAGHGPGAGRTGPAERLTRQTPMRQTWERLLHVAKARVMLVVCDFDGTLAPHTSEPEEALALPRALTALIRLAALPRTSCCIISDRSLIDLWSRLPRMPGVTIFGSHGGEGPGCDVREAAARSDEVRKLASSLKMLESRFSGVRIEKRSFGVAVRFRGVPHHVAEEARRELPRIVASPEIWTCRAISDVVEYSLLGWRKPERVLAERNRLFADTVIHVGDDETDEAVFEVLRPSDMAVRVGAGSTNAWTRVSDPSELGRWLRVLELARRHATTAARDAH